MRADQTRLPIVTSKKMARIRGRKYIGNRNAWKKRRCHKAAEATAQNLSACHSDEEYIRSTSNELFLQSS